MCRPSAVYTFISTYTSNIIPIATTFYYLASKNKKKKKKKAKPNAELRVPTGYYTYMYRQMVHIDALFAVLVSLLWSEQTIYLFS